MSNAVIFSDLMAHLVGRLSTELTAQGFSQTRVSVLADESPSQVILRRDGGTRKSKTVMTSIIGVNCYAANYSDAESLANMVEAIFDDLPDGNPIVATSPQSSFQDVSDLKAQRRFMSIAVDHRGSSLTTPNQEIQMALDSDNVRVAVTGAVYVGPTTSAAPTTSGSTLTGFTDLGYVSSDGITETIDKTTNQIRAWQGGALVREVVSEGTYSVSLTFIETNQDVLELYFGASITGGVLDGDPTLSGGRKSFVMDIVDGSIVERTYIPAGEITSVGERTLASGEAVGYQVVITAYADSSNVTFKKFFSTLEA